MMHSATIAIRRRMTPRLVSIGRWMPVLLSALALVTGAPAARALTATTTTLTATPGAPASGAVMTLTADVTSTSSVRGGTVTFFDTYNSVTEVIGTTQVQSRNGRGKAILRTEVGGVGTHKFLATYGGTSTFQGSSSSLQSVTFAGPYATATALSSTGTGPYTLTGTVSAFGPVAPTGTVTFTDTTAGQALGTAPLVPPATQTGFPSFQTYPIANMDNGNTGGTNGPAIGDFNNDGRPDYAVPTNGGANGGGPVVILLGNGDGTFTTGTPVNTTAPFTPTSVVVGDFNGDGDQDLAVLSAAGTGSVNIYLGNGNGTFQAAKNYPVAASTSASRLLAVGDFNRDGIQDLVASNSSLNQVAVILGNGDGSFGAPSYYTVQAAPWNIVVGDINQDGFLDLAVAADASGSVSLLEGNGDGTFKPYTTAPTFASQVGSVAIGDFNGDGWPDLAFTSAPDNAVYVLINEKTATPSFATPLIYPMNGGPYYLTIGDFDRDGHLDIISANDGSNNVGVLLNNGDGTFGAATYYPVGGGSIFANAADINGDDRVDLTAVTGNGLSVLLSGESASASKANIAVAGCKTHALTATYNSDVNYAGSVSPKVNFNSIAISTTLSLTLMPAQAVTGQQSTWIATLSPYNYGTDTTNGEQVSFLNGGTVFATAPLTNGVATFSLTPTTTFSFQVQATYPGDACGFEASASNIVDGTVLQSSTLTWANPAPIPYGTPLSSAQLNATDNAPGGGTYTYTPAAGTVLPVGTQTLSVTFVPNNTAFATETATVQIVVSKGPFLIWPTPIPITYGTPLTNFQLDATASSGTIQVPLDNYYNVDGIYNTGLVYSTGGYDNDGYSYSSSTLGSTLVWNGMTFNIGPANAPDAVATPNADPTCFGSGCAPGPAMVIPLPAGQFSSLYMLGAMVNNINPGQTFIVTYTDGSTTTYNQNMSDWYNAAGWSGEAVVSCSEDRNFSDGKTATTQADSVCVYGYQIPLDATKTVKSVQLPDTRNIVMLAMNLATPSIPGTFVYTPPAGSIEPVGTNTLSVTFTPADTTTYQPVSATVQLVVEPPVNFITTTTISWPTPAPITYGTPLSSTQLDAVAMGSPRPTQVALTSPFVVATSKDGTPFNQTGFDNAGNAYSYNQLGNGSVSYAGTTFILGQPNVANAITSGAVDTLATPGNYSAVYLIGAATTDGLTNQPFTLTYSDGSTATALVSLSSWSAPAGYAGETVVKSTNRQDIQNGGHNNGTFDLYGYEIPADPTRTLVSITLPNTRNVVIMAVGINTFTDVVVPGTYTYNYPTGDVLGAGTYTLTVTFKPTDPAGYTTATGSTTLVVNKATPIITWATPAPSLAPALLTGVQLDATANVKGKFVYTPASGLFGQGVYTLSTTFTPTDTVDYTQATASVQWVVGLGETGISGTAPYTNCCFFSQPTPYTVSVTGFGNPLGPVQVLTSTGALLASGTLSGSGNTTTANLLLQSGLLHPGSNTVTLKYLGTNPSTSTATVFLLSPAIPVNPAGLNQTVTTLVPYTFAQAGKITSYTYNPNTEFTDAQLGTVNSIPECQAGATQAAGYTCNFTVAFNPLLPGVRKGTIVVNFTPTVAPPSPLPDPEPTLYLFLSGMGESAQIALSSATQSQLNTSNTQFQALAFNPTDAFNSTLYVANSSATPGQIDLLPSTGGSLTQWNAANTTSLNYPSDASFDAFNNFVVSDYYGGQVYEYAPTTLTQTTVNTTGFTMVQPTQAKVDLGGNLYIADTNSTNNTSRIIQVPGEAYAPSLLPADSPALVFAQALAVDNTGANLYVGDGGLYQQSPPINKAPQIVQIALGNNGSATTASQYSLGTCANGVICTLTSPAGFAFDLNNDLYVLDSVSNLNPSGARVLLVPNGHASKTSQLPITGLIAPTAITLDAAGNIYVADVGFVSKLSVNSGALVFPSAGSSLPTTITNTGDLPLFISSVTLGNGNKSSFTQNNNCTGGAIAPGDSCTVTVKYANAGKGFDTLTLSSNAYSPTGVTIQLSY
jgi:FG-GAP-like repeat/Bacterial Ig-like domain (group 3)